MREKKVILRELGEGEEGNGIHVIWKQKDKLGEERDKQRGQGMEVAVVGHTLEQSGVQVSESHNDFT